MKPKDGFGAALALIFMCIRRAAFLGATWLVGWMHLQREETPYDREGRIISVEQFIAMNNKHMQ